MELVKRNIHMDCQKCKASAQITLEDDVNISDSKPDAYQLIMDRGNVVIDEVKVSDDHVSVKGRLQFKILYLTEDKKGDVATMEGNIPFEEQIYMEGVETGDSVSVDWDIEDLTVGLINSRKFSVQSLVMLKAHCEEIRDEETAVDLENSEAVEFRKKNLDIAAMKICKKDILRVKEEVEIPGSFPNILSLIWWDVMPCNVEFKILSDKITAQGEIRAFFLYRGEGEEDDICHYETVIPFAGTIDCMGAEEGMIPEIRFVPECREVSVQSDFDGEERVITFELCLNLVICAYEEERLSLLSDVYGVTKEVSVSEKEASFRRLLTKAAGKMKLAEHFKLDESHIVRILHTAARVQIIEQAVMEEGIEISGVVNLQLLYESADEEEKYGMMKENIPFSYMLEADGVDKDCTYVLRTDVEQITVLLLDGSEIDVKCVLFFGGNVYKNIKEKIVEEIEVAQLDSEKMAELPGIAVYMVRDGESLWDIGKRYYVPVSALMETNQLSSEEVKPGDRILIVKSL
ncbi:MAG: DUF3794 domain-containing protein [Lachnospiraceae bacterium]|nr:DUF3794 domain-containing protein [Lachnospiraceae bacterium]